MARRGKSLITIVFGIFILVYTLSIVSSVNIGISPASVKFTDVMRDGYAERYVAISADSESSIQVTFETWGDIKDWVDYPKESILVSKESPAYVKISINPPSNIPNGNYTGFLKVQTESFSDSVENHAVGKIKSTLDLSISVSVTDVELIDCVAKNIKISSAEKGDPILLKMLIENKGNVQLNPRVIVDIWNQDQDKILQNENLFGKTLLPTIEDSFEFEISSRDLELGQYWSDISIPDCLKKTLLTFDILEEGAMKSNGVLLSILSKKMVKKKETMQFEVNFKNIGEKSVKAQFKGQVMYEGKIVQLFESERLTVPEDTIEKFNLYFTPQKEGKYIFTGRVYYDGKRTFEGSNVVDVVGSTFSMMPIIYTAFLILIAGLIFKIRSQKRMFKEKMRRLK